MAVTGGATRWKAPVAGYDMFFLSIGQIWAKWVKHLHHKALEGRAPNASFFPEPEMRRGDDLYVTLTRH